jgi:hypothetical protein
LTDPLQHREQLFVIQVKIKTQHFFDGYLEGRIHQEGDGEWPEMLKLKDFPPKVGIRLLCKLLMRQAAKCKKVLLNVSRS